MDLGSGASETSPSHPTQSIRTLPGAEDLLDPSAYAMDRGVPSVQFCERLPLVASPHRSGHNVRRATFGSDSIAEMRTAISAIGEHVARIIRQRFQTGTAIMHIGRCHPDFLDQRCARVGSDMGFEAVHRGATLVLDPTPVPIRFARRGDDRGVDEGARLDRDRLGFSSAVTFSNSVRSNPRGISARRKRTKAVRSGVASVLEKPQKRRNDARSASASASLTSDRSCHTASSSALKIASGGQAGSPLLAG